MSVQLCKAHHAHPVLVGSGLRAHRDHPHVEGLDQARQLLANGPPADHAHRLPRQVARHAARAHERDPGACLLLAPQQRQTPRQRQHARQGAGGHHRGIGARGGADLHTARLERHIDRAIGAGRVDVHPAQALVGQQQVVHRLQLGVNLVLGRGAGHLARDEGRVQVAPLRRQRRLDAHPLQGV
jgi:hypothetical protein